MLQIGKERPEGRWYETLKKTKAAEQTLKTTVQGEQTFFFLTVDIEKANHEPENISPGYHIKSYSSKMAGF